MERPTGEELERFAVRTAGTDEATLYRNLGAGVYGVPGSRSRAVAEQVLSDRLRTMSATIQATRLDDTPDERSLRRAASRRATAALWLALIALAVAVAAWVRAGGP